MMDVAFKGSFVFWKTTQQSLMASHIFHIFYSQLRKINHIFSHTHIYPILKDPPPGGEPPIPRRYQKEGGWLLLLSHKDLA